MNSALARPVTPKPKPPLGQRLGPLLRQRIVGDIDHIVEKADGNSRRPPQPRHIQPRMLRERINHEARQIERTQEDRHHRAAAVARHRGWCRKSSRNRTADSAVHPVDEDHAGFCHIIGGVHDPLPQRLRLQQSCRRATKLKWPVIACGFTAGMKASRHQHRDIEVAQARADRAWPR